MKEDDKSTEFQILEAAEKLFLEQGYAKTTTGQIAKLAGCNQALVHYYYRTKDNLFEKIFEKKVQLMATNILVLDSTTTAFEEKLAKMVGLHFDFLRQNPKLAPFILNEILTNPERVRSLFEKLHQYPESIFAQLETYLQKEAEKGTIRLVPAVDILFTLVSLNVTPFLIFPTLKKVLNLSDEEVQIMLEHRKQESIETILSRLRK